MQKVSEYYMISSKVKQDPMKSSVIYGCVSECYSIKTAFKYNVFVNDHCHFNSIYTTDLFEKNKCFIFTKWHSRVFYCSGMYFSKYIYIYDNNKNVLSLTCTFSFQDLNVMGISVSFCVLNQIENSFLKMTFF